MDPSCHLSLVSPWWEFVQETVMTALYFCWVLMCVHCNFILIPGIGMDILWPYSLKIWTLESGKMTLRNRPTRRWVSIWQSRPQRPSYWHCLLYPQLPFPSALGNPLHSTSAAFSLAALPSNSLRRKEFRLLEKKQPLSSSPWLTHSYKVLRRDSQLQAILQPRNNLPPPRGPSQGAPCQKYCMACQPDSENTQLPPHWKTGPRDDKTKQSFS